MEPTAFVHSGMTSMNTLVMTTALDVEGFMTALPSTSVVYIHSFCWYCYALGLQKSSPESLMHANEPLWYVTRRARPVSVMGFDSVVVVPRRL